MGIVRRRATTAVLSLSLALTLGACGGSANSVSDNKAQFCNQALGMQANIVPMIYSTNPSGTVEQALAAGLRLNTEIAALRNSANAAQQTLVDRFGTATSTYTKALQSLPPATPLAQQINALDTFQSDVEYTYRSMLSRIGCSMPPSPSPVVPQAPAPAPVAPTPTPADQGGGGQA